MRPPSRPPSLPARLWRALVDLSELVVATRYHAPWDQPRDPAAAVSIRKPVRPRPVRPIAPAPASPRVRLPV